MSQLCNDFLGFMSSHHQILGLRNRNVIACRRLLCSSRLAFNIPRKISIPTAGTLCRFHRGSGVGERSPQGSKGATENLRSAQNPTPVRRVAKYAITAIGGLDAWFAARATLTHIDSRVSGSANTDDLISGKRESISKANDLRLHLRRNQSYANLCR
jgi:hypothetical protein